MKKPGGYGRVFLIAAIAVGSCCHSAQAAAARTKIKTAPDYLRSLDAYFKKRGEVLDTLQQEHFCADVPLNQAETNANNILSQMRSNEVAFYKTNGRSIFPPSRLFFEAKADIEASKLFPIFKRMPKGGLLHTHDLSAGR